MSKNIQYYFRRILFCSAFFIIIHVVPAHSQSLKTITLKDGTVLKGKIVELKNEVYTIETSHLGTISVKDSEILEISSAEAKKLKESSLPALKNASQMNPQLMNDVAQLQETLIQDPNFMVNINNLVEDEEMMQILMDPNLMSALMSQDPNVLENDARLKKILDNPHMMKIIGQIQKQNLESLPTP